MLLYLFVPSRPSGTTILTPTGALTTPTAYVPSSNIYAYATATPQLSHHQPPGVLAAANHHHLGAIVPAASMAAAAPTGAATFAHPQSIVGRHAATVTAGAAPAAVSAPAAFAMYQPIVYWYPSPPVSPQSAAYYIHAIPTTVNVKGLPANIQTSDILAFLEGTYEVGVFGVIFVTIDDYNVSSSVLFVSAFQSDVYIARSSASDNYIELIVIMSALE